MTATLPKIRNDLRRGCLPPGLLPAIGKVQRRGQHRADVVGIFPNEETIYRLVGAILLEQNNEWSVQRARYMTLGTIAVLSDDAAVRLPAMAD